MNTIISLFKRGVYSFAIAISSLVFILPAPSLFAQQTMSLGDLRFVLPDAKASLASRTLRKNMSASKITSQDLCEVGGIAFTQKAIPAFTVQSTNVFFSKADSTAHVVFNGVDITVPLAFFQLRPIVNFANSDKNVVMTRYGQTYGRIHQRNKSTEILYHPAFIDNLLGLRLLQVDVMGELGYHNIDFPRIGDEYFLAPEEKLKLDKIKRTNPLYQLMSFYAIDEVASIINEHLGDNGFTFIYTDVKEPIYFDIDSNNNELTFKGHPYFFSGRLLIIELTSIRSIHITGPIATIS